mmetsp:Transcript_14117/g.30759  ORF Transcript_14117/g.30759 Transcript_14117/m.30759 type:complete len:326 (-) Transcript_14117:22-999(-)
MIVRPTLQTREHSKVDFVFQIVHNGVPLLIGSLLSLSIKDHGTTWTTQTLVCGCCDNVRVGEARRNNFGRDETGNMRHVRHDVGADAVGNLTNAFVINQTRVCRCPCHNQLWAKQFGTLLHLVVVNYARRFVKAIGHGFKVSRDHGDFFVGCLISMRQVASVRKIERKNTIVGLQKRRVHLKVGRGSGQGLDIHAPLFGVEMKGFQSALLTEDFDLIDIFIASVVPCTWISFTIFVGEYRSQSIQDGLGGKVFAGNQHQRISLTSLFLFNQVGQFGVDVGQGFVEIGSSGKASDRTTTSRRSDFRTCKLGQHDRACFCGFLVRAN